MPDELTMDDDATRTQIWRHISNIGTCMMVTSSATGVRARPMRGIVESGSNAIWFFSDRDTEKTESALRDTKCCLTFADIRGQTFVSATGELALVDDREEIRRLWSEGAEVYFPGGADDNSVVLLRFSPEHAAYWDAPSNPVVLAIKLLQAKVTGERPVLGTNEATAMT
jgi:general stress protein 26